MYRIVELLYFTPETNITLYANYTSIKKSNTKYSMCNIALSEKEKTQLSSKQSQC